jgi:hypothetical protein
MRRQTFLWALFAVSLFSFSTWASDRPFPATTKRGRMTPEAYPDLQIDGKPRHLAPGARIWNTENLIEMPAALRGSDLIVNYTENNQGDIDRVWILTPAEASEPLAQQTTSLAR